MNISLNDVRELVLLELVLSHPNRRDAVVQRRLQRFVATAQLEVFSAADGLYAQLRAPRATLLFRFDLGHVPALVPILVEMKKGPAHEASGPLDGSSAPGTAQLGC